MTTNEVLLAQYSWLPLAPIAICTIGATIAALLYHFRWMVHVAVVLALLFLPYLSIHLREVADPTLAIGPGPGDGLVLLAYLIIMVVCLVMYGVAIAGAWLRQRNKFERMGLR
jgi:hypothetical protein